MNKVSHGILLAIFFIALIGPGLTLPAQAAEEKQPNIVLIMADDMGYGDVQAYNEDSQIPTPNLNRLATQGMQFLDMHTPSGVCTPTRYGLLTGRYPWRTRLKSGVLWGYSRPLMETDRETLGSMLKRAGYATACVGKWHLGLGYHRVNGDNKKIDFTKRIDPNPTTYGFDFSYVIPASLDMDPYIYVRNDRAVDPPTAKQERHGFPKFIRSGPRAPDFDPQEVLDRLLSQSVQFIEGHADTKNPFFLYFPLTAPHKPVWPKDRFKGNTELGPYGDFITQVDWTVGQVMATLEEAGIEENTLLIYTSDNGSYMWSRKVEKDHVSDPTVQAYHPDHHRSTGPLRGVKADVFEGGNRVPFLVHWPGHVAAGSENDQPFCLTDVYATLAAITGTELKRNEAEDSFSLLPVLSGEAEQVDRAPVIHQASSRMKAIRDGKWKLILGNGSGGRSDPRGEAFKRPYQLYNLDADISETTNLIQDRPEVAKRLENHFKEIRDSGRSRAP